MNWTSTPPTTPGFYAWRLSEAHPVHACTIQKHGNPNNLVLYMNGELTPSVEIGGQWCKLVPADEIENAWDEARETKSEETTSIGDDTQSWAVLYRVVWEESRAKRVMEGLV